MRGQPLSAAEVAEALHRGQEEQRACRQLLHFADPRHLHERVDAADLQGALCSTVMSPRRCARGVYK